MTAGAILCLVARPRQRERRFEVHSASYDLRFSERNHGSNDLDHSLRTRPRLYRALERRVEFRSAIRITRRIFSHCADVDTLRADGFGPARGNREQVRVAKGNVAGGDMLRRE